MPKKDFLRLYRQVSTVTKLLFAPCGLADQTVDIAGLTYAQDIYKATLQQLEDMVSKLIFKHFGVEDDVIVASMHEYVGKIVSIVLCKSMLLLDFLQIQAVAHALYLITSTMLAIHTQ